MRWAAILCAALFLAGCETKEDQGARINQALPSGCSIKSLGKYGGVDDVVVVFCNSRTTTTTNYTESHSAGKFRRTEQKVSVLFDDHQ